jgi:UDP-N-acetylmuramate--alanine ligase
MRRVHFIGIGGSGLSAIARVLLERSERVSGSDRQPSPILQPLHDAGARLFIGHQAENVIGADIVVRSSAIPDDNVEVQAARSAGIQVVKRAEFLAEFLREYQVIAVAGTHGKTTTTAMIAWMLTALGLEPSYIIGGVSKNLGSNAHAGKGKYFVIEADEYDRMFLGLTPEIAVVTNVEYDHPDCFPSPQDFYRAFQDFVSRLVPGGTLVACVDDPRARQLLEQAARAGRGAIGYGLQGPAGSIEMTYTAQIYPAIARAGRSGDVYRGSELLVNIRLQVPGEYNLKNALAVLAVADLLQLPIPQAARALGEFRGTGRRFDVRGDRQGLVVIDDYAHHPTEIKTTLAAARDLYPEHEIWAVWQPHTFSRTRALFSDYLHAFKDADHVVITEIYPAREEPPANGFSSRQVVAAVSHPDVHFSENNGQAVDFLTARLAKNSVLIVLSAGDADQISTQVLERMN